MQITAEALKSVLDYNPDTGIFTWNVRRPRCKLGGPAGSIDKDGYLIIKVMDKSYKAHRLAWLYVTGSFPKDKIDHINGVRDDNRICNIREASSGDNSQNVAKKKGASSKFIGVTWDKEKNKWSAQIQVNRRKKRIGRYESEEEAHKAYAAEKLKLHKFNLVARCSMMTNNP